MRRIFFQLNLFLLLLFFAPLYAAMVTDLNSINIPVTNRDSNTLQQALPDALGKVLVRLSGNTSISTLPDIQNDLPNATRWLQSYRYETVQQSDGQTQLQLHLVFDQKGLYELLHQSNQPLWSEKRPLSLVWLQIASNNPENNIIVAGNDGSEFVSDILQVAQFRGIPVLLPIMDLKDQGYVNTNANQDFNLDNLKQVAKRYAADEILAGNVMAGVDNNWSGEWLFWFNDQAYHWNNSGPSVRDVINLAVNKMADIMANTLAVMDNQSLQSIYKVQVMGIQNLNDFAKVIQDLKKLSMVSSVVVDNMGEDVLVVSITSSGDEQSLVNALSAQHHFAAIPNELSTGGNADLYYRWQET